jgi:catechol-2,3-dioxygenase
LAVPSPAFLSHVVLASYDADALAAWYQQVLRATVPYQRVGGLTILAFDEEHHRLGVTQLQGEPTPKQGAGLHHVAFRYLTIRDLLQQYSDVKELGHTPMACTHHGITMSMYYLDPDSNVVEFMIDCFETAEETHAIMNGEVFQHNALGLPFEPENLLKQMERGATDGELMSYDMERSLAMGAEQLKARSQQITQTGRS